MAEGGCPPPAPADPDVPDSGIRLLEPWYRCTQSAHPRGAISCASPLPAALPLRRNPGSMAGTSVRTAVHDPIRRFPPPGPRGAGSPTSPVLSADSDSSPPVPPRFVLLRLAVPLGRPASLPPVWAAPAGRDCCLSRPPLPHRRWRRRDLPGSWATLARMPPSRTPAEPPAPDQYGAAMVPSALVTASASATYTHFVAQSRGLQGFLCTLRRQRRHCPRNTRFRLAGQPWPVRTPTCRVA